MYAQELDASGRPTGKVHKNPRYFATQDEPGDDQTDGGEDLQIEDHEGIAEQAARLQHGVDLATAELQDVYYATRVKHQENVQLNAEIERLQRAQAANNAKIADLRSEAQALAATLQVALREQADHR